MKRKNILLMISHDTGRYLGCYGQSVETPAIDALAEEGVRFSNYFCPAPQCSPSRGSILTGLYPQSHGMIGLSHLGFSIDPEVTTLPMSLSEAGYETALIGFSHETIGEAGGDRTSSTYKLGYETVLPVPGDRAADVAERVVSFLEDKASGQQERPFFASVGFFETHRDFDEYAPVADPAEKIVPPPYLPDTERVREDFALLHGSVKTLDHGIDRILSRLDALGLAEETLVIYTTDHGIAFPRAKGTLMDAGLETALIMRCPGTLGARQVNGHLLCNIDLMPTLLEFAGAAPPKDIDGFSFYSLLENADGPSTRDHFFAELTWHDDYHPMRGVRTDRYKYIRNFEDGPAVYLPLDIHLSPSGHEVREQYYKPNVPEELYDLANDPLEERNLAGDPAYQDILLELRGKVEDWMISGADRLLSGKVPGTAAPGWQEEYKNGRGYRSNRG
ncbi:sulfatase family protein [Paenibacillus sabinae]|uniref:N-sulfoglucosamine sulfohydrolase n=1 Tax=Paenibacillus sabinae T27 TaxID=1268072 RepID=X4ZG38_9BACL|nr:sulfatase [Paenibacillus sabinae]AHV96357.1 N-sulfoglucosamine sulfohydrolase [Paenibacillus sabinae T27]